MPTPPELKSSPQESPVASETVLPGQARQPEAAQLPSHEMAPDPPSTPVHSPPSRPIDSFRDSPISTLRPPVTGCSNWNGRHTRERNASQVPDDQDTDSGSLQSWLSASPRPPGAISQDPEPSVYHVPPSEMPQWARSGIWPEPAQQMPLRDPMENPFETAARKEQGLSFRPRPDANAAHPSAGCARHNDGEVQPSQRHAADGLSNQVGNPCASRQPFVWCFRDHMDHETYLVRSPGPLE